MSVSELLLILLVALLVIKPEQLPEVAEYTGRLVRLVRQIIARLKSEIQGLLDTVDNSDEQKRKRER